MVIGRTYFIYTAFTDKMNFMKKMAALSQASHEGKGYVRMKASLNDILKKNGIMLIDGSMGSALEELGANLNNKLWTACVLAENPDMVKTVHLNYFRAGADSGITCSYQATIPGLMANGYSKEEAEQLIRRSVEIFLSAREEWWESEGKADGRAYPLCLAGIGPYGAYLADGSEYTGNYNISDAELDAFHRHRAELLSAAGADILLFETQPSLKEVLIEAQIAEELEKDYWISFSCMDGKHTNKGEAVSECAKILSKDHPHLKMIGVNCTKPEYIVSLIGELKKGTSLPIAVYPNSGETYDPTTKNWTSTQGSLNFSEYALQYMMAGASAVGGCCTTVDKHIRQVVEARAKYLAMGKPTPMRAL